MSWKSSQGRGPVRRTTSGLVDLGAETMDDLVGREMVTLKRGRDLPGRSQSGACVIQRRRDHRQRPRLAGRKANASLWVWRIHRPSVPS